MLTSLKKKKIEQLKDLYKRSGVEWEAVKYKNSKSYHCWDNKKLIGYCQVLMDGTILNLVVDKEYRRQGIASELLKLAISNRAKYLGCFKSNVKFYVNRGFKVYYVKYSKEFKANMYYMKVNEGLINV